MRNAQSRLQDNLSKPTARAVGANSKAMMAASVTIARL
jgi:hypothetical protein